MGAHLMHGRFALRQQELREPFAQRPAVLDPPVARTPLRPRPRDALRPSFGRVEAVVHPVPSPLLVDRYQYMLLLVCIYPDVHVAVLVLLVVSQQRTMGATCLS